MLVHYFTRIPEFSNLPPQELRALAARAHVICMPPERWLLRDGRHMAAYLYLLRGTLQTRGPTRKWRARKIGRLLHFYPGCQSVRTLSAVQVLRVDAAEREFLLNRGAAAAPQRVAAEPWLRRFLQSHMMKQLAPSQWQRLLASFEAFEFAAGSPILCRGQPGRHCFVLEAGHAVVHRGETTLAHLCPGDFFGEDALVLGSVRNADVSALEDVRVQAIERGVFARLLLENLVEFVEAGCGTRLDLGGCDGAALALAGLRERARSLNPKTTYYVCGGTRPERALAVLILMQRGIRAHALTD